MSTNPALGYLAERRDLHAKIVGALHAVAPTLANDPAHARFVHRMAKFAEAAGDVVGGAPFHARAMHAALTRAVKKIPGSGNTIPEHARHGGQAETMLGSARGMVMGIAADADGHAMANSLRRAADHLRISNHLQKGRVHTAAAHVQALDPTERAMIPQSARAHITRCTR